MGLFGKMFEKKTCSICGGEIGLLGNRKLEDGNLCKECAGKLSPFFSDRRASTVEQIAEQLEYREANRQKVAELNVTRTLGCDMKVMLDEDAKRFIVTRNSRWRDANPDVMDFPRSRAAIPRFARRAASLPGKTTRAIRKATTRRAMTSTTTYT